MPHADGTPHGNAKLDDSKVWNAFFADMAVHGTIKGACAQWGIHPDTVTKLAARNQEFQWKFLCAKEFMRMIQSEPLELDLHAAYQALGQWLRGKRKFLPGKRSPKDFFNGLREARSYMESRFDRFQATWGGPGATRHGGNIISNRTQTINAPSINVTMLPPEANDTADRAKVIEAQIIEERGQVIDDSTGMTSTTEKLLQQLKDHRDAKQNEPE